MACKYKYENKWYSEEELINTIQNENSNFATLYDNLLKELESGRGKEVLERVKKYYINRQDSNVEIRYNNLLKRWQVKKTIDGFTITDPKTFNSEEEASVYGLPIYTLEEQQEEAIVELLGLMTAEKLDAIKDGKLISLLKRLLKEMATFMRNLLRQKEIEVDKLPDNMTLNDIANILAYSNSKIILPGNEVIYTTPDNQTFKTYQEASNHISKLANKSSATSKNTDEMPNYFSFNQGENGSNLLVYKEDDKWLMLDFQDDDPIEISEQRALEIWKDSVNEGVKDNSVSKNLQSFIEKNKEFEQSKEIIEKWKKVNGIKYNPEEIYSRGQGFYSVVGAYSTFDVKLMFQNLLHHIEDNKKAGGHFAISAFTKPIDKNISHLEGGGGKIKFVIYPKSEDILWATNKDAYSGSVWDAGEKVNKDKKSELLGVSYTKYPSLQNINSVQPNLASIIDNLSDHHNELGIVLGNNFRLIVDEDVPYEIKRLVGVINSVLDDTYGKIKKPNIEKFDAKEFYNTIPGLEDNSFKEKFKNIVQPTITEKDLKETFQQVKLKLEASLVTDKSDLDDLREDFEDGKITKEQYEKLTGKSKEYNEQALINTKIAALKEVAKKYPRSLIRSEVINSNNFNTYYQKSGTEGGQEMQGKLSKDNVQVGDLIVNNNVGLRVTSLNENDLTTEDGQTIPYDADFNVFRVANQINDKFKGKIVYATPGTGKSFAQKQSNQILDLDELEKQLFNVETVDEANKMYEALSNEDKILHEQKINETIKKAKQENKTIITSRKSFIDKADFIISHKNTQRLIDSVASKDRENPYNYSEEKAQKVLDLVKGKDIIELKDNEFVGDVLFGKNEISENPSLEDIPFNEHETELSENKPIEDLAMEEELDNTVLEVEEKDLDWWRKIYLAYDAMKKELANTSQSISGKILYNDSSSQAKNVERLHEDNLTDTPMLKAIKQAASIALYVSNLKYNLLTKGEVSVDESAQTNVLNSPLLGLAKKIKEAYKGDTSTWTNDEHIKYNKMAEFINTYIEKHSPDLKNLKQIIRQSRNQTNDINDYLRSIGQAGKFETTLEEMQTVIDAMEEIQFVMQSSSHFPSVLMINNREEIAKKIASDNEQITRANNKIEAQIAQKEERKIKKPEEIEKLDEDIAKLKNSIKPLKSLDNINEIQNSLMTGNDNGFLKAVTGSIHDLGDTSMSLLANRVQEAWQKMQNSLAPIGKTMTDAWNDFAADKGMIFSDDVMKNFTEIIEYTDMQGIDRVEKHFISDRNLVAYYADYHETANKIKAVFDEIAENKKGISTKPVADAAEDAQQKADNEVIYAKNRVLHAKIKDIQEEFTKKQVFDGNIIDIDEEGNAIPEGKNGIKNFLQRTYQAYMKADPNQGFRLFSHYLKSNFDISNMQYENKSWRNNSEESYIAHLVDKNFPDILIKKYNSKLLKPKSTSYPSDKISKLSADEKKLFDVVTSIYYDSQRNLPSYSRPGTRVPSIPKEWMQKNMKDKFAIGKILTEEFADHFSDEVNDNDSKKIPIYYSGNNMKANEISDNYVSTVLMFAKQAAAYRTKANNLYLAKEMHHTLQKSKKQDSKGNVMVNKALAKLGIMEGITEDMDWRQWFLEKWVEQVFYGKSNQPINIKGVRVDKVLDKLMGFSAFGTLGGVKVVNFFTNISMANISNLMNSIGYFEGNNLEKLYSASQYAKAVITSGKVMFDMLLDHSRQTEYSSSVFAELMDELEPLQGEYFDKFGNQLNKNFLGKAFSTTTWFAPMHLGEVQPQISAMVAMLENIPVTLLDGKKTTLWKALTMTNDLSKNWENIENWRTIKEDVLGKKKLKLEEINRKLHGNYKSMGGINKPIMRQFVFGRMLESYRKWIVPGVLFRYKEDDFSINRSERSEGKYRTLFNYILTDAKWMWEGIEGKAITPLEVLFPNEKNIDKLREYFSDEQLVNIRQAVMEQAFITLTSVIAVVLYALGKGGDDDNYALMTAAAISMRLSRDFNFFQGLNIDALFSAELILNEKPDDLGLRVPLTSGLSDVLRIGRNPFPMMKTLDQFDAMFEILTGNPSATFVSGKHKGESKLSVATMKLLGINIGTDGKIILDPITK